MVKLMASDAGKMSGTGKILFRLWRPYHPASHLLGLWQP